MIKILLVDDEPKLRKAWERLFGAQPDFELLAALSSADELASAVQAHTPHVCVVDLTMPGADPLEEIRKLNQSHPAVRTVVYSGRSDPSIVRAALDAGAWAFVDKLAAPGEMFGVIRRVMAGEAVFPPELTGDTGYSGNGGGGERRGLRAGKRRTRGRLRPRSAAA